jgi:hypothetical protein
MAKTGSHVDRGRTPPASEAYKKNIQDIDWGPLKEKKLDPEKQEQLRKDFHAREAEDGKKDAQWYLDNERRVPMQPDAYRHPPNNKAYRDGLARIFGDKDGRDK